jgi:hypothetical protein
MVPVARENAGQGENAENNCRTMRQTVDTVFITLLL